MRTKWNLLCLLSLVGCSKIMGFEEGQPYPSGGQPSGGQPSKSNPGDPNAGIADSGSCVPGAASCPVFPGPVSSGSGGEGSSGGGGNTDGGLTKLTDGGSLQPLADAGRGADSSTPLSDAGSSGCRARSECAAKQDCVQGECIPIVTSCTPSCVGIPCGDDHCGTSTSCGECPGKLQCQPSGQCKGAVGATCTRASECGSDSCNAGKCDPSCSDNNGGCDPSATCSNTPSARQCTCNAPLKGSGLTCAEAADCTVKNGGCHANAICTPVEYSRTCVCKAGYLGDGTSSCVPWTAGLQLDSPWPTFHGNPWRTGLSPNLGPQTNKIAWSVQLDGKVRSPAAIAADGTVYVVSGKYLNAIRPDEKKIKWKHDLGTSTDFYSCASPTIDADGTVYVLDGQRLTGVRPDNTTKWVYQTAKSSYWRADATPIVAADGSVIVVDEDRNLAAIGSDGKKTWGLNLESDLYSSPIIGANGTLYVGGYLNVTPVETPTVFSVNPGTSIANWSTNTLTQVNDGIAMAADGTIYAPTDEGALVALAPDGSIRWTWTTPEVGVVLSFWDTPSIGPDGTIYAVTNSTEQGIALRAFSPRGTQLWSFPLPSTTNPIASTATGASIGADGTIYIGGGNIFHALDATGKERWRVTTGTSRLYKSNPAIGAGGHLYLANEDGIFYDIGP